MARITGSLRPRKWYWISSTAEMVSPMEYKQQSFPHLSCHSCSFSDEHVLTNLQRETLRGIVSEMLKTDAVDWNRSASESFAAFQEIVLTKTVPTAAGAPPIFLPSTAVQICDHILLVYYRNFMTYKANIAKGTYTSPSSAAETNSSEHLETASSSSSSSSSHEYTATS